MSQKMQAWRPIVDFEVSPLELARPELTYLREIWKEQRTALEGSDGLRRFTERLRREWAIETGLLERIYHLDRGVTELLVENGIVSSLIPNRGIGPAPEHVAAILRDHEEAVDLLFDFVGRRRELSVGFIKELHALFTRNQASTTAMNGLGRTFEVELLRGEFKRQPNNPRRPDGSMHLYCPPEQVSAEMDRLMELHRQHEAAAVPPEVEAAWLHHRFTQIHPFQDGNGRVARSLATLVFVRGGLFPLVIRDAGIERARYIGALERGDAGDLEALVRVFVASQRRALLQAIGVSTHVGERQRGLDEAIDAIKRDLERRRAETGREASRALEAARELHQLAVLRLDALAARLRDELGDVDSRLTVEVDSATEDGERNPRFLHPIATIAKELGYSPDLQVHQAWVRLQIHDRSRAEILVSFHGVGKEYRGILAASACFFRRTPSDEGLDGLTDLTTLSDEVFQINDREPLEEAQRRFESWLEEALLRGLEAWRRGI